ncbi:MAG: hypothetical protein CEE40_02290 [Chloroflexi bacterium B3_Chlor]|nr:MAG: hypothetical protein CEE40_02290 [Chloroflexi bacterium B3_Chlor]
MRRILCLTLAIVSSCIVILAATVLAQASSSALRLGWMIPQDVSQSGVAASRGPYIVADGSGYLHLIWMDDRTGQGDLYYARSEDRGNTWSNAEHVDTTLASQQGSFVLDITGTIHACWRDQDPNQFYLKYAQRTPGTWLQETIVPTTSDIQEPSIASTADYLHVVWSNKLKTKYYNLYYTRRPTGDGEWDNPTVITDTGSASLHARVALDGSDNLHVVWQEYIDIPPSTEIMYISGTVDTGQTTWSAPITLTADLSPDATSPHVVVGDDYIVHIAFGVDVAGQPYTHDLYYATFPVSNTENILPTVIPGSRVFVSRELPTYASPSVALDGSDNVHVVWNGIRGTDSSDRIYYAMSEDQGASWSQPMAISPPNDEWADGFATIATDGTLIHIAWQQKELADDNDIYYVHSLPIITYYPLALKDYS